MSLYSDISSWFKPAPLQAPLSKEMMASISKATAGQTISNPPLPNIGQLGQLGLGVKRGVAKKPVPITTPYVSTYDNSFLVPPGYSGQPPSSPTPYNDPRGSATTDSFMQAPASSGQGGAITSGNGLPRGTTNSGNGLPSGGTGPARTTPIPLLTTGESLAVAKSYGLEGMEQNFAGMTSAEANKRAKEAKDKLLAQTSSLTSGTFNPQTIAGVDKTMEVLKNRLIEINGSPFDKPNKESNTKNVVSVSSTDIAKNFTSLNDFQNAQLSPDFMRSIEPFLKAGGTLTDIAAKITPDVQGIQPATDLASFLANQNNVQNQPVPIKQINNPDGTITQIFKDNTAVTTGANGRPVDNQDLYNKILPETLTGQNEIARLAGIPEELKKHYFGTPEQIGIYQQEIDLQKEKRKNLEKKEADEKATAKEKAQYSIDKNKSDIATAKAKRGIDHLNSKNYMTGMLAKLGALMTTGAAPLALATLEEKYSQDIAELDTKLSFANREIEINLTDTINDIENNYADKEYSINEDLSKSANTMSKEIFEAQQTAQRDIYKISSASDKSFRAAMDKHDKDTSSSQAKYATTYMSLAGKGLSQAQIMQILTSTGIVDVTKLTPAMMAKFAPKDKAVSTDAEVKAGRIALDASKKVGPEADGKYADPNLYQQMHDTWTSQGGTTAKFIKDYPPSQYINPANTSLPAELRPHEAASNYTSATIPHDIQSDLLFTIQTHPKATYADLVKAFPGVSASYISSTMNNAAE